MKKPGEFFMKQYPIFEPVLKAALNGHATNKFVATGSPAGVFDEGVYAKEK